MLLLNQLKLTLIFFSGNKKKRELFRQKCIYHFRKQNSKTLKLTTYEDACEP
jgi:hypothetical protein